MLFKNYNQSFRSYIQMRSYKIICELFHFHLPGVIQIIYNVLFYVLQHHMMLMAYHMLFIYMGMTSTCLKKVFFQTDNPSMYLQLYFRISCAPGQQLTTQILQKKTQQHFHLVVISLPEYSQITQVNLVFADSFFFYQFSKSVILFQSYLTDENAFFLYRNQSISINQSIDSFIESIYFNETDVRNKM